MNRFALITLRRPSTPGRRRRPRPESRRLRRRAGRRPLPPAQPITHRGPCTRRSSRAGGRRRWRASVAWQRSGPSWLGAYQPACDSRKARVTCDFGVLRHRYDGPRWSASCSCTAASRDAPPTWNAQRRLHGTDLRRDLIERPGFPPVSSGRPSRLRGRRRARRRGSRRWWHTSSGTPYGGVIALLAAASVPELGPLPDRDRAAGDGRRTRSAGRRPVRRRRYGVVDVTARATIPRRSCAVSSGTPGSDYDPPSPLPQAELQQGARTLIVEHGPVGRPRSRSTHWLQPGSRSSSSRGPPPQPSTPSVTSSRGARCRRWSCRATGTTRSTIRTSTRVRVIRRAPGRNGRSGPCACGVRRPLFMPAPHPGFPSFTISSR